MKTLEDWRSQIDTLDEQLLQLLIQRAECALQIGYIKRHQQREAYDPQREETVLKRLVTLNQAQPQPSPLPDEVVRDLFAHIIRHMRQLQS